jgi:hypothetical protein
MNNEVPCPSCGFFTIGKDYFGTYSICGICGWEDDGVQLANPACGGGANGESLIYYQKNSIAEFPLNIQEHKGIKRDASWRPLTDDEIALYEMEKQEKYWRNKAILNLSEAYWKRV